MGADTAGSGVVGGRHEDVRHIFQSGHPSRPPLRIIDVGSDPPSLSVTGGLPQSGCLPYYRQAAPSAARQQIGVPIHRRGYGGGGTGTCRGVHNSAAEHYRPVHYDSADLRDLHMDGEDGIIDSAAVVVGTVGGRFHGSLGNGVSSSRSDGDGGRGGESKNRTWRVT